MVEEVLDQLLVLLEDLLEELAQKMLALQAQVFLVKDLQEAVEQAPLTTEAEAEAVQVALDLLELEQLAELVE